jgi:4,5-dihydroxyphthalate decarboxylase
MKPLTMSLALTSNPRSQPVLDGEVGFEGFDVIPSAFDKPGELFWRQLRFGQFDISEMSLASLAITIAAGSREWTPIPVFPQRAFFHTRLLVSNDAGITAPEDLVGKRIGINEYQNTASVWMRGALEDGFGVAPDKVRWFTGRPPLLSHAGATGFTPPPGVEIDQIPAGADLGTLVESGGLDAVMKLGGGTEMNPGPSEAELLSRGRVRRLFPDPVAEGRRFYAATGLYPINHVVVVRSSIVAEHPWVPLNLLEGFEEAKRLAARRLRAAVDIYLPTGEFGLDLEGGIPYGVQPNRLVLERLTELLYRHGLTNRRVELDEIFPSGTYVT